MELSYKEHVNDFRERLEELREAYENEDYDAIDPLCIDSRIRKRIWLSFGGPNVWIDIIMDEDGIVESGKYEYRWGSGSQTYELSDDEADEIAQLYGLSY